MLSFDELPDRLTVTNTYYYDDSGLVEHYAYTRLVEKKLVSNKLYELSSFVSCLIEIQLDDRTVYLLRTKETVELLDGFPKQWTVYLLSAKEIEVIT